MVVLAEAGAYSQVVKCQLIIFANYTTNLSNLPYCNDSSLLPAKEVRLSVIIPYYIKQPTMANLMALAIRRHSNENRHWRCVEAPMKTFPKFTKTDFGGTRRDIHRGMGPWYYKWKGLEDNHFRILAPVGCFLCWLFHSGLFKILLTWRWNVVAYSLIVYIVRLSCLGGEHYGLECRFDCC